MKTLLEPAERTPFPLTFIDSALLVLCTDVLLVVLNRSFEKPLSVEEEEGSTWRRHFCLAAVRQHWAAHLNIIYVPSRPSRGNRTSLRGKENLPCSFHRWAARSGTQRLYLHTPDTAPPNTHRVCTPFWKRTWKRQQTGHRKQHRAELQALIVKNTDKQSLLQIKNSCHSTRC